MIHEREPTHFQPKFEVAACYLQAHDDTILLLQYNEKKGAKRWVPWWKLDPADDGNHELAVLREIQQETGLELSRLQIEFKQTLYLVFANGLQFTFHCYTAKLDHKPDISIQEEHQAYQWVHPEVAARDMYEHLIEDEPECIEKFILSQ